MQIEPYDISHLEGDFLYLFFSVGSKGIVPKVVEYECIDLNFYNLAFGDLNIVTNTVSDKVGANNGDTIKVIATVMQTIPHFFELKPEAQILFTGSNPTRTKLYNRILKMYIHEFTPKYEVFGIEEGGKAFTKFDIDKKYIQFSIKMKSK